VAGELLESVELQRVRRIVPLQRDDGAQGTKLVLGKLLSTRPVATGKRRLQLAQPFAAVTGTVFDRPNSGIGPPTPTSELFVTRTILHQEVAEVLLTVSQSSPSVAT